MSFAWLKPYLPGSLYGRAILILLLPVVTVTLVVSVVFIQRHIEGVTTQMTVATSREVELVLGSGVTVEQMNASAPARTLLIRVQQVTPGAVPEEDDWLWYDVSGGIVAREFHRLLPDLRAVEMPNFGVVHLYFDHAEGAIQMSFDRRRASAANPHQLLVNLVFFAVLMTVIAYFYLRNQLRPITRLARAADAFGKGRHVAYQPSGAVEVRAAGQAFVDMRARIERQIEQRTLMLSGVSHDLRTPLTRLKLGLELLDDEDRRPMEQDVEDMERLIDEFLDFARGTRGGEPEPVDPVALARSVVEDAQRAHGDVTLYMAEGEGEVMLRRGSIRRALENLVSNATRYGTKAEVSVLVTEQSLRIRVEDDGPGIPEARREEAMRPFTRLDAARNQNKGSGVGLGLSIALDIARAHGGVLRLGESARLGGLQADIVIGR